MNEDSHVGSGHFVWIGLKVGLDVDDKRGTDRREQTSLVNEKSTIRIVREKERKNSTHKDEAGVEVLVVLPDILAVKFVGFPAVGGEEVSARIVGRQWFKEVFEDGMEATSGLSTPWRGMLPGSGWGAPLWVNLDNCGYFRL